MRFSPSTTYDVHSPPSRIMFGWTSPTPRTHESSGCPRSWVCSPNGIPGRDPSSAVVSLPTAWMSNIRADAEISDWTMLPSLASELVTDSPMYSMVQHSPSSRSPKVKVSSTR